MRRKLTILVDMDSIIADFYYGVIEAYERDTGEKLPPEFISGWDTDFPNGKNIFHYFSQPGFFRGLKPIAGAQEVLKGWHDAGDEIVIASAATLTSAPGEKYEWLSKHYPWIHRDRVCFFKEKFRLHGDILIDDHADNTSKWRQYWSNQGHGRPRAIGIEYPYNAARPGDFDYLVDGYLRLDRAWETIESIVDDVIR